MHGRGKYVKKPISEATVTNVRSLSIYLFHSDVFNTPLAMFMFMCVCVCVFFLINFFNFFKNFMELI